MQPANDDESRKATVYLAKTGICLFELSKNRARLKLIAFGSRSCNDNDKTSIHLQEKELADNGTLGRTVNTYGATIFIEYVIVLQLKTY